MIILVWRLGCIQTRVAAGPLSFGEEILNHPSPVLPNPCSILSGPCLFLSVPLRHFDQGLANFDRGLLEIRAGLAQFKATPCANQLIRAAVVKSAVQVLYTISPAELRYYCGFLNCCTLLLFRAGGRFKLSKARSKLGQHYALNSTTPRSN